MTSESEYLSTSKVTMWALMSLLSFSNLFKTLILNMSGKVVSMVTKFVMAACLYESGPGAA